MIRYGHRLSDTIPYALSHELSFSSGSQTEKGPLAPRALRRSDPSVSRVRRSVEIALSRFKVVYWCVKCDDILRENLGDDKYELEGSGEISGWSVWIVFSNS